MYSRRSFRFVEFSSFLISCYPLFWLSVSYNLLVLDVNDIFWCCVLYFFGHFVNCIVSVFQFTSRLYLNNQLYFKNMSIPFKFITAILICSLYLLISTSSGVNHVTSPFLVLFTLKTLNDLFIGSALIFFFY